MATNGQSNGSDNRGFVPSADVKPIEKTYKLTFTTGIYTNRNGQSSRKCLVEGVPFGVGIDGMEFIDPSRRGPDLMFGLKEDTIDVLR
jgi:hypothetical protein